MLFLLLFCVNLTKHFGFNGNWAKHFFDLMENGFFYNYSEDPGEMPHNTLFVKVNKIIRQKIQYFLKTIT